VGCHSHMDVGCHSHHVSSISMGRVTVVQIRHVTGTYA